VVSYVGYVTFTSHHHCFVSQSDWSSTLTDPGAVFVCFECSELQTFFENMHICFRFMFWSYNMILLVMK